MKEEEHIIDYILKVTSRKYETKICKSYQNKRAYEKRKKRIDDTIFYCEECKQCWSIVTKAIDTGGFRIYPSGNMPSIGKKRKKCVYCTKKEINEN